MRRKVIAKAVLTILLGCALAQWVAGQKGATDSVVSGYVLLPDESQKKAQGIEIRIVSATKVPLCSFVTEENGHFQKIIIRAVSGITVFGCGSFPANIDVYFLIKLEGYAELFEPWRKDAGNVLQLLRGPSELMDATHREELPLTSSEAFRKELVSEYNELAVRNYENALAEAAKNPNKAISDLNKAIKAAPMFFEAYLELGTLQREAKAYDAAVQSLRKATELKPTAGEAAIDLGAALLDSAGVLGAASATDKATATYTEAAAVLGAAVEKAPWSSNAYYYLGSAQYKLNQLAEAESSLMTSLTKTDPRQDARLMLVNIYMRQRRHRDALAQLTEYLSAVPDGPQRAAAAKMQADIQKELNPRS